MAHTHTHSLPLPSFFGGSGVIPAKAGIVSLATILGGSVFRALGVALRDPRLRGDDKDTSEEGSVGVGVGA